MNFKIISLVVFLSVYISTDNVKSYDLNNYRLPTWAYPDNYDLTIDLRWPEADTFTAYTRIDINVTEENHYELVLNVDPLYIDVNSSTITVNTLESICDKVDYSNETQIMVLTCTDDMWGNNTHLAQFEMQYTAKFSESPQGLYKHTYQVNGITKSVIFTQFEPTRFRKVFPSFDEPCFKAPIRMHLNHFENLTVASNTIAMEDLKESSIESSFNVTPSMSSYLVAVVAGSSNDWAHFIIPGCSHFYLFMQKIHEDYVSITKDNAPALLEKMGDWTGIPYANLGNPKMTFAALPGMSGAMENWGLITFGEGYLIDEGDRTTSKAKINSLTVMAHELSHQWFGDYVTTNWWSETWLNEGFASYFEWYLADMLSTDENDYEFDTLFVINILQPALQADETSAQPLSNNDSKVNTPDEISETFGTITYAKGGSVVRMLRYALGEDVFQKGIQSYLKAKALGNAKASDVLEHLQAALPNGTDIDLPTYMDSWLHQPDYPIVKTSWGEADNNNYLISLDIYKYSPSLNETHDQNESIWWVPISYITWDNADPDNATYFWINYGRTFGIIVPKNENYSSWGIVNAGASGLYRVDYDPQTLSQIINVLNNPDSYQDVPTENRAQILDDVFNVAKFYTYISEGYSDRPYQNAFEVAQYLQYETEYIPWYTFLKEVNYLLDEIQDDLTKDTLKENVLALIEPQLIFPDPTNTTVSSHSETLKINLLLDWACRLNHEDALAYVKSQYPNFLSDPKSIDSNYRDVVICHGIRTSDDMTMDYATLTKLYTKSILPQEKSDIALGLACMTQSNLLKSYLASTLTAVPPIEKQYWAGIFKAVYSRSSEGLDAALYFTVNHIDDITTKWNGAMKIESFLGALASKIVKPEQIKMLQDLLSQNSLNPTIVKALKGAIKKAKSNLDWIDKRGTEITSIVVYNGEDPNSTTTSNTTTTEKITTTTEKGRGIIFYNGFSISMMIIVSLLFKHFF